MTKYLLLLFVPMALVCCKKSSNKPASTLTVENYFSPKAGNYWVYEEFDEDSTTGIFANTGLINDSIFYANDSVIGGNTYHVFYDLLIGNANLQNIYSLIWRDSSGYMLNQNDQIQFSTQNFTDTLQTDSMFGLTVKYIMINNVAISTPAGPYTTLEFKGIVTASNLFAASPNYYYSFNYVANVGLVLYHFFSPFNPGGAYERRLIRYHLN